MTFIWLIGWLCSSTPSVTHGWLISLLVCAFIDLLSADTARKNR